MRILDRLRGAFSPRAVPDFDAVLAPATPLAVIGDVHGRADLLSLMLEQLERDAPDHRIVLVGDYLDRGEESRAVLEKLRERSDLVCLKGNHEAMCLAFLEDPAQHGSRWLRNGGLQTLASFGVGLKGEGSEAERMTAARDAFADALEDEGRAWLAERPLQWRNGNVAVVHAAADPGQPLQLQTERTLLWGHPQFESQPRSDGIWIVHGHTIYDEPFAAGGRIAVDTGAYASGRLSAALVAPAEFRFLQVTTG
ncbi:MAG: metallophosphoesterase [Limimaricola soesokkakensis]|uniref:metallophosphoesterase n=1 Tax=Limimaricola soesokkakensis TaxID=1343159 RepID=UPI00405A4B2C